MNGGSGSSCIFPSLTSFEEHCNLHHPWIASTPNTDEIQCKVPGCTYISYGEVQYYAHFAANHRNTVKIIVKRNGVPYLSYRNGNVPANLGQRCPCLLCKRVFFTSSALRNHIIKYERHSNMDNQLNRCQMMTEFMSQPLPDHIVDALKNNPVVFNKEHLHQKDVRLTTNQVSAINRITGIPPLRTNQVLLSPMRYSKGKKSLILKGLHHDNNGSLDRFSSCTICEYQLRVHMPPGICILKRQPIVTLRRDELQNYMMKYAFSSGAPIPHWYRKHVQKHWVIREKRRGHELAHVRMGRKKEEFPFMLLKPHVNPQFNQKRTTSAGSMKIPKFRRATNLSDDSPVWLKYCRKCYKFYEVFVLREECVHKRYIIVSLVNPGRESDTYKRKSTSNGICGDDETTLVANEIDEPSRFCIKEESTLCDDVSSDDYKRKSTSNGFCRDEETTVVANEIDEPSRSCIKKESPLCDDVANFVPEEEESCYDVVIVNATVPQHAS